MVWYASRIAEHIPSITAFYIFENGYEELDDDVEYNPLEWYIEGWLHVEDTLGGGRRVTGTRKPKYRPELRSRSSSLVDDSRW